MPLRRAGLPYHARGTGRDCFDPLILVPSPDPDPTFHPVVQPWPQVWASNTGTEDLRPRAASESHEAGCLTSRCPRQHTVRRHRLGRWGDTKMTVLLQPETGDD